MRGLRHFGGFPFPPPFVTFMDTLSLSELPSLSVTVSTNPWPPSPSFSVTVGSSPTITPCRSFQVQATIDPFGSEEPVPSSVTLTVLPLVILYFTGTYEGDIGDAVTATDMPPQFAQTCDDLNGAECMQYFIVSQFMLLFMMVPMIVPITFASYSIVGEKSTRTLEPLLATPISTFELLLGKALAATLPAIAATWLSFFLYAMGVGVAYQLFVGLIIIFVRVQPIIVSLSGYLALVGLNLIIMPRPGGVAPDWMSGTTIRLILTRMLKHHLLISPSIN